MILFTKLLRQWYQKNRRILPWRMNSDPYRIWVSEIMLQQTRVNQAIRYYNDFLGKFPTLKSLAKSKEQDVLKAWEGLGYYSRARNLHHTAKDILNNHQGRFPQTFDEIIQLKGIGNYTAAAIASIAFKLPYAVVDGNVNRVLARYLGVNTSISTAEGKKEIQSLATQFLDRTNPGEHNQAMIEFGALQCKPVPDCTICPLNETCVAYLKNRVKKLPRKAKKNNTRKRVMYYIFYHDGKQFYIKKRTKNDIWKNLYELPMIETGDRKSVV